MSSTARIGVVICSSRRPRVCPQIADFVIETLTSQHPEAKDMTSTIDIAERNLPFFDEPGIPSQVRDFNDYAHEHTRQWSLEVQKYKGFIFVLPQYNWGYPAVLKNAIDYLFHEWAGKPAMIVSYGGHGGTKAAGQLRQVLEGLRMKVVDTQPALAFGSKDVTRIAASGNEMPKMGGEGGLWEAYQDDIVKGFCEMSKEL